MTSKLHEKCDICFQIKNYNNSNFHFISCCKNNFICIECFNKMLSNYNCCPFCRKELNLKKKEVQNRRRSSSFSISEPVSFLDQHVDIESFDDNTYYSRLYRRQQNTIQRLRNSEENRLKNREIRLRRIQKTQSDKKKEQKHIHFNIQQEINDH